MNLDRFLQDRRQGWVELDALVRRARRRPERLGADGVRRLGRLYRAAAADLAVARRQFRSDPVVATLEGLVGRSRGLVYESEARRAGLVDFVTRGYWRRVRERPGLLAVAATLTFAPAVLTFLWALRDPGAAGGLVPGAFRAVTEPKRHGANLGIPLAVRSALATQIFTNNIRVAFAAFATGITAGLGTGLLLVYNGVILGVVGGLAFGSGNGSVFTQLVTAHGVLELSCIVVAGMAGLRLGMAVVDPGYRRRSEVIVVEARRAVELALGTAPWLVVAGLVEGFLTPAGFGLPVVLTVGFGLGALYWALVLWRGRPVPSEDRGPATAALGPSPGGRR